MDEGFQKRGAVTLDPHRSQTTRMCDVLRELGGKIVPITCLGAVRRTCKEWNELSKTQIVCKAEATDEFFGFMVKNYKLCSMRFNLRGIRSEEGEEFVGPSIKEIGGTFLDHSDGLLLCVQKDRTRLVVWNPYLGQARWIEPRDKFHILDRYALGYDDKRNPKILRFVDEYLGNKRHNSEYQVYDFSSSSWRVLG